MTLTQLLLDYIDFSHKSSYEEPRGVTIDNYLKTINVGSISDGYHSFDELYDHRIALYMALCSKINEWPFAVNDDVWKSKLHSDGSSFEGWFVLGLDKAPGKQITYHLPMSLWDQCSFAVELERAPEFDGHTPADVLQRLKQL